MSNPVSLELTADSKRILSMWAKDKTGKIDRIINYWLISMLAWMERDTMKAFDDGKRPGGMAWTHKYTDVYAAWKASLNKTKMGILSGALRRSFADGKINKSRKQSAVGSPLPYATSIYEMFPYFTTVKRGEDHGRTLFNQLVDRHLA